MSEDLEAPSADHAYQLTLLGKARQRVKGRMSGQGDAGEVVDDLIRHARLAEVRLALDEACSECRKGNPVRRSARGGVGHRIYNEIRGGGQRAYWVRCGQDTWHGRHLAGRLAELQLGLENEQGRPLPAGKGADA